MEKFNPRADIANSQLILDNGDWPNFHDAEMHQINLWRGDIRPDDNVWVGPQIEATFELCALQYPYLATLRFYDCESVRLADFNHQNAIYDLIFEYRPRGVNRRGESLPLFIAVTFEQAFGARLTFLCMRIEALQRQSV